MGARHQSFGVGLVGFVDANDIAYGIYLDVVKAAGAHAEFYRARAFTMRVSEVGDSQFFACSMWGFFVDKACVAKLRQPFVPIPHLVTECRLVA